MPRVTVPESVPSEAPAEPGAAVVVPEPTSAGVPLSPNPSGAPVGASPSFSPAEPHALEASVAAAPHQELVQSQGPEAVEANVEYQVPIVDPSAAAGEVSHDPSPSMAAGIVLVDDEDDVVVIGDGSHARSVEKDRDAPYLELPDVSQRTEAASPEPRSAAVQTTSVFEAGAGPSSSSHSHGDHQAAPSLVLPDVDQRTEAVSSEPAAPSSSSPSYHDHVAPGGIQRRPWDYAAERAAFKRLLSSGQVRPLPISIRSCFGRFGMGIY